VITSTVKKRLEQSHFGEEQAERERERERERDLMSGG
jgi:hypothetical protein